VIVLRVLGGVFLLLAAIVLSHDLIRLAQGAGGLSALGELWYSIDAGSLNLLQAGIQRHVAPEIWDGAIVPLLLLPAVAVTGGLGLVLYLLGSLRRGSRRR